MQAGSGQTGAPAGGK
ncbi:hypothetical protein [Pseudomonas fluorescens]